MTPNPICFYSVRSSHHFFTNWAYWHSYFSLLDSLSGAQQIEMIVNADTIPTTKAIGSVHHGIISPPSSFFPF